MDHREDRAGGLNDPIWTDGSLDEQPRRRRRSPILGVAIFVALGVIDFVHGGSGNTIEGSIFIALAGVASVVLIWTGRGSR